jgi:hypothetical protein
MKERGKNKKERLRLSKTYLLCLSHQGEGEELGI